MSATLYLLSTLGGYVLTSALLLKCPGLLHRPKRQRFRCRHISHRGGEWGKGERGSAGGRLRPPRGSPPARAAFKPPCGSLILGATCWPLLDFKAEVISPSERVARNQRVLRRSSWFSSQPGVCFPPRDSALTIALFLARCCPLLSSGAKHLWSAVLPLPARLLCPLVSGEMLLLLPLLLETAPASVPW